MKPHAGHVQMGVDDLQKPFNEGLPVVLLGEELQGRMGTAVPVHERGYLETEDGDGDVADIS